MSATMKSTIAKQKTAVYCDFEAARERLLGAIRGGPFYGLLTGPSGTGKTSLLREVASALDRHRFQVHYLAHSQTSTSGVGRFLAEVLHLTPRRSHTETLRAVGETLRELPFRIILFVDEAHLLSALTLGEIRLLAEIELDAPPLFAVLFSGLPELRTKLDAPALFPLKRRLALRLELRGLRAQEVIPFLVQRLGEDAASKLVPEATALLFERARGIPALVETLARRCLDLESLGESDVVDLETISEVLDQWDL